MRIINKNVEIKEMTTIKYNVIEEHIITIYEDKIDRSINVCVGYKDAKDKVINRDYYLIAGENYELLMSESPNFAVNKPLNEYRETDLWYIIDLIRDKQNN